MSDHHSNNHGEHDEEYGQHHILSTATSRRTLVSLLALTVVTVAASRIDLGTGFNFVLAMLIATGKAMIVTQFFMGLRYDSADNRAYFYSAAFFILVFLGLTASDIFTRPAGWQLGTADVYLKSSAAGGPDIEKPWEASPEILVHGKKLFDTNCQVCHGAEGRGDGPGSALPVKPRNFHEAAGWKNPRRASNLMKMLETGIPPFMPPYGQLSDVDRWALAHYVLQFGPAAEPDDAKSLAAVGIDPTKENGGAPAAAKKRTIPADFALERYVKQAQ